VHQVGFIVWMKLDIADRTVTSIQGVPERKHGSTPSTGMTYFFQTSIQTTRYNNEQYRVSQKERSIFWEVIVPVILSKKSFTNMCPIPNGFRDRAI
jgi:hypothetical protein